MRSEKEIQGSINLMGAYLKDAERDLLRARDHAEVLSAFTAASMWRYSIEQLMWVLQEPREARSKETA